METRKIGSLDVSVVGVGCNNFGKRIDEAATRAVVEASLDAGINFFDTADIYGGTRSEAFLGRVLGARRADVIVASKFGMEVDPQRKGAHPDYVRRAAEDSLQRLGTDYIDLYQLHEPDPTVPIADTLGALDELVKAGKVREIGCSNFSPEQLREAEAAARGGARFVSVQNEYSLLKRDPEGGVLAECERSGLGFLPYYPLASGLLTGKYRKGKPMPEGTRLSRASGLAENVLGDDRVETVERLVRFAEERGHTILELAFSWLLARPVVSSVIAGATRPEQVRGNVAARNWKLTADEMAALDAILAA
jgi:aryl-alcohol dehydrogenase-like predicted oxidoreductase